MMNAYSYARACRCGLRIQRFATPAVAAYPERPVTLIVPWAAGGGTDATARIIGEPAREETRPAGDRRQPHRRQRRRRTCRRSPRRRPDGYTIGLITVEIGMMHWQGLTELSGASYTPIGLVNADPAGHRGARRRAVQERQRPGRRDQGQPGQVQGVWHRAGRHLASGDRRHAAAT